MTQTIISQRGKRHYFDALIIGSGLAALSYALELCDRRPNVKIALVTKNKLEKSNSYYAQGGIAAAIAKEDTVDAHIEDTLKAGAGLSDKASTESILNQGKDSIDFLIKHKVQFDLDENDEIAFCKEGGHSANRILHSGDRTGKVIVTSLIEQILKRDNITLFIDHTAVNLITDEPDNQPASQRQTLGCYCLDNETGLIHTLLANVTVLATGGAGKIYRYTTNPDSATGDGVAMAYRAGARVSHMEFYQFHPTLLYHPNINNFLISEALRGEGAYLRLASTGERFMQRYEPEMMELATRDIVARAIFSELERTHDHFVYLDIRHKDKAFLQQRFPMIYQTLYDLGIDISQDMIPVVPAAHYMCGGIISDEYGRTDLARLFAIGETAFTGLHGANRLASNSLLEAVVTARNAVNESLPLLDQNISTHHKISDWDSNSVEDLRRATQISAHWRSLRGDMHSYAGIIRTEAGLTDLLQLLHVRRKMVEKYYWRHIITQDLIELRNIILVAELIVKAAIKRTKSCGCHYREDDAHDATQPKVSSGVRHHDFETLY